jgi:hypothetical protein
MLSSISFRTILYFLDSKGEQIILMERRISAASGSERDVPYEPRSLPLAALIRESARKPGLLIGVLDKLWLMM